MGEDRKMIYGLLDEIREDPCCNCMFLKPEDYTCILFDFGLSGCNDKRIASLLRRHDERSSN